MFLAEADGKIRINAFASADEDVSAPGPSVKTGAGVPGYSGGVAAAWLFWIRLEDPCPNGRSVYEIVIPALRLIVLGRWRLVV